jgi:hypothetical protein
MVEFNDLATLLARPFSPQIFCLMKFGCEEHMQSLRTGQLFCRALAYYKQVEGDPLPFQDPNEGLQAVYQADHFRMVLKAGEDPPFTVSKETGLVGQVLISSNIMKPTFCLHAVYSAEWDGRIFCEDEIAEAKAALSVDPSMEEKFGKYVWLIRDAVEFRSRLKRACARLNVGCDGRLVRYIAAERVHGAIPAGLSSFVKFDTFKNEREYRLVFHAEVDINEPFILDVGSLEDISVVMPCSDFRRGWEIRLAEATNS